MRLFVDTPPPYYFSISLLIKTKYQKKICHSKFLVKIMKNANIFYII
jgi:hypothetical protein